MENKRIQKQIFKIIYILLIILVSPIIIIIFLSILCRVPFDWLINSYNLKKTFNKAFEGYFEIIKELKWSNK